MRARSSSALRRLVVVPIALLLATALLAPTTALAAEPTSGYSQTVPTPKTSVAPSKESGTTPTGTTPTKSTTPASETSPATSGSTPSSSSKGAKSSTLPFTGIDLRWALGIGVLLIGAGFSIFTLQRRRAER